MKRVEVSCISKTNKQDLHERISHIGGMYKDTYWRVPIAEAIHNIEMGFFQYYVSSGGHEVAIIVAARGDRKYLKTESDGTESNNLLELPECSSKHR